MAMFDGNKTNQLVDPKVIAQLAAIPINARRPMIGNVSGRHTSPHRGSSVEFAEYRKYVPGDDLRKLDWRALGRSDRYYVKEFEADTNLRCMVVLDTSGSMGFGSAGSRRIEYAQKLAATLAYLAILQGDAAGLTCLSDSKVASIPPRRNPAHLAHLLDVLSRVEARGGTQLPELLHEVAETTPQRALMIVISDFLIDLDRLRNSAEHLRFRKHDVIFFHLLDPEELGFDFRKPTRFVDIENGQSIFVEPEEIVDRYQAVLQEYLSSIQQLCRETSTEYFQVSTNLPYEKVVRQFLIARNSRRGARSTIRGQG